MQNREVRQKIKIRTLRGGKEFKGQNEERVKKERLVYMAKDTKGEKKPATGHRGNTLGKKRVKGKCSKKEEGER